MIVVDSSALIAILRGEPEAYAFLRHIHQDGPALISAATRLECWVVCRRSRDDETEAKALESLIDRAGLVTVPFDEALLVAAIDGFARFGRGQGRANLNYGDCFSYALAKSRGLPLLFKGQDFHATDIVAVA